MATEELNPLAKAEETLTPQERRLKLLLRVLALIFGLAVFGYLVPALVGPLQSFYVNLPFVTNSVVKIGVLALLAFFAAADIRRYRLLIVVIIIGHVLSELATGAVLIWGKTDYLVNAGGIEIPITQILWGSMVLDGAIIILLIWFSSAAERSHYKLLYLSPVEFRTLTALADVVVAGKDEIVPPEEVARNVDRYLNGFEAKSKWIMNLVLTGIQFYPLLSLRPPFSYMNPEDRLNFLKRRFYQDVTRRLVPPFWRTLVQVMIRIGKQLSYIGYYNDPRTFESVGYVPFSKRNPAAQEIKQGLAKERKPLRVYAPSDITGERLTGDVVIIGSGAGASVLAEGLLKAGREVLMLERGDYVDPTTFSEDEVEMLGKLYHDGALQLSRDFRFQVLQGSCVGGTTVVNNAVCFNLPPEVLTKWNDMPSLDAGLDPARVRESFEYVRTLVGVERQNHKNLNLGARYFTEGIKNLRLDAPPNEYHEVEANIHECLGCGYCNIGCAYGKKLSMMDTVLPMLQGKFNNGREALRIVAGCEALKLRAKGKKVTSVLCRLKDGRLIEVQGNLFVSSAGAISSSLLLLKSGVGGDKPGKKVSFNIGSPMTAVFDDVVNSYEGLQISHYLKLSPSRGYVIETWFNPPVAQALTMPGWFEDHYNNMRRYNRIACTGVLVGTESNAEVRHAGLTGREINYVPTPADMEKLIAGLILSGEVLFNAGARLVIPNTFDYYEFKNPDELRELPTIVKDQSDITLGTGHPQGGNPISRNPEFGVIDPQFKVYGYENLFVCDASVFPSSIGVNPQLTVMALAHYAAPLIAQRDGDR
jgi:choline dehydrogenase-like flavoprotein